MSKLTLHTKMTIYPPRGSAGKTTVLVEDVPRDAYIHMQGAEHPYRSYIASPYWDKERRLTLTFTEEVTEPLTVTVLV